MLIFQSLLIICVVLLAQHSSVSTSGFVSIKCNQNITLGSVPADQFQNTTTILTNLLDVTSDQILFSVYENQLTVSSLITSNAMNPLIYALHLAFSEHLVLKLSPDVIWYVIADAVAQYTKDNSEKMRSVFVDFEGKRELIVKTNAIFEWSEVINDFNTLLTSNTKQPNNNLFAAEFSTTTTESLTATHLTRMDGMQKYFSFTVFTLCGIPEIKLLGERKDWTRILEKVDELVGLVEDMNVWRQNLKDILNKFVDVYDDKTDMKFWNDIFKIGGMFGSGNPYITGWVTNFFPYITSDEKLMINSATMDSHWKSKTDHQFTTNDFNPKMGKAPFMWIKDKTKMNMTFFGGLYGVRYEENDKSLMPIFGYGIYRN